MEIGGKIETIQNNSNYSIVNIRKNNEKNPVDVLSVRLQWKTQQLTLVWKTRKE